MIYHAGNMSRMCVIATLVLLSSCGGAHQKAPDMQEYARMRYTYDQIVDEYQTELSLADTTDTVAIHRCVLSHADETRRNLGNRSGSYNKYQQYASYPVLAYTSDLRAAISDLERMSARLMAVGSTELMQQVAQDMRKTVKQLCMFKGAVVSDARYLQEQDKWDAAQTAQAQQATMNALLLQSVNAHRVQDVQVHSYK